MGIPNITTRRKTRRMSSLPSLKPVREPLQLSPDVLEIIKALLLGEPFGGEDGPFGEGAAGFGVVTEVDSVVLGFKDEFVQADDFAFAEGNNLEVFVLCAGFADHALE